VDVKVTASGQCRVLLEDPELAACLPVAVRGRAIEECLADVVRLSPGLWDPTRTPVLSSGIGLLVLDGLLIRRVGVDGRFGAELLGDGDLLRPWQGPDSSPPLPRTTGWRLLAPTRLALLDERAAESLARYPSLTGCLVAKAVERARNLAVNMAIVHQPRTDVRLQMLFWHLADRWGRVRADGVVLPLRLTHAVLADLIAVRRPTVSTALVELARRRLVTFTGDVWHLHGAAPGELLEVRVERRPSAGARAAAGT
jgi:CRP/FNR family transcriptional regulator, cyclic AMP receptor protein